MIYLYSGFGSGFAKNIKKFIDKIQGQKRLALLLQGGEGYEKYLGNYLKPFKDNGISNIEVVVPKCEDNYISNESISIIDNSDAIFIGGGVTDIYCNLYCTNELKNIFHAKYLKNIPFAGLSAGSKIMNDFVYLEHCNETKAGLALVNNMQIFPHFEEDSYAYKAIEFCMKNKILIAYGLETNSYLEILENNKTIKNGEDKSYILIQESNNIVTIIEFF